MIQHGAVKVPDSIACAHSRFVGTLSMSDPDLYSRWNRASWSLAGIFPPILLVVQGLGAHDVMLRLIDSSIEPFAKLQKDSPGLDLNAHLTQSYLWVLGVYEITRTIAQHGEEDVTLFSDTDLAKVRELKNAFARIRVPLAKLEPARKHRDTDYSFPWPAFGPGRGTEWAVSPTVIIFRSQLADAFLDVFETIRHSRRGDARSAESA